MNSKIASNISNTNPISFSSLYCRYIIIESVGVIGFRMLLVSEGILLKYKRLFGISQGEILNE
jgi:hypothetical protein